MSPSRVQVLAGTRKGAFIYTSNEERTDWQVSPPIMPGWTVTHLAIDTRRQAPRLLAAANHWAWGPSVARSDDGGESWDQRSPGLAFPEDMGISVEQVWHVEPGHPSQPGVIFAGTQPAGLFRSDDGGESWSPVDSINRHPYREFWFGSGGGDSCLHSIQVDPRDPQHIYVSISTGGTYESTDGGETWSISSHRVIATTQMAKQMEEEFLERFPDMAEMMQLPPNVDPAAADEFHKLLMDPKRPNRLWGQSHIGVFRLDAGSTSGWVDVTEGLPSFHGFPLAVTSTEPDSIFVVPLAFESDNFRVCPGQFTVYRTRDDGATWEALTDGLPGPHDYQSVYREGLDTDGLSPEGIYVGTSNGEIYASNDCGDHWQRLPGTLPPVLSITSAAFDV